ETIVFISRRRRHTRSKRDWSSDVCSSDLIVKEEADSINEKLVQNSEPNKFGYSVEEKTGSGARNIVFGGRKMDTGILVSGRNRQIGRASCRERVEIRGGEVADRGEGTEAC